MLCKKGDTLIIINRRRGMFFFEFLTGMFLLSLSLSILWSGFLHILKNCNKALDLYTRVTYASSFLESDKNCADLKKEMKLYSIKEESKKLYLEMKKLSFPIQIITVSSLNSDNLEKVELWEYRDKS